MIICGQWPGIQNWVSKMAKQVKALAGKPDDLRQPSPTRCLLTYTCTVGCVHALACAGAN